MNQRDSSPDRLSTANWTLESLIHLGDHFLEVRRVSASLPKNELLAAIQQHEYKGLPLVIEGWHKDPRWNAKLLNPDWLASKYPEPVTVRNVYSSEDQQMPIAELLSKYSAGGEFGHPEDTERWYGKDLPFPPEWDDQIKILPSNVLPLGAGDSFAHMDSEDRPETIMCYLGVGDTYTPAHKDSSASTGQNLMVYTSPISPRDDSSSETQFGDILDLGETSSFWFLSASEDSSEASDWFLNSLGQELDLESHAVTLDEFKSANFPIHVCQQKLGDMVIVPRMSCHQVVNHGGVSLKVAWSRMPMSSMEAAITYELPIYRRVGRPEIYRVKRLVHQTIEQLTPKYQQLPKMERHHFARLVRLMSEMHIEEYHPSYEDFLLGATNDLNFTCDCCSADIFQSYFECKKCTPPNEPDQFYTMCTTCYVEGRSCKCGDMTPRVLRPWPDLLRIRNNAALVLGMTECTLKDYDKSPHLAIFKAAVLLSEQRKASTSLRNEGTRRCSPSRPSEKAHIVPFVAMIRCSPCHRSICFQHTIQSSFVHAAEALLMIKKDPTYVLYHNLHIGSRARWKSAHRPGSEINNDIRIRLSRVALKHPTCRPADSARTRLGWYDDALVVADKRDVLTADSPLTSEEELVKPNPPRRTISIARHKNDTASSKPVSRSKRARSIDLTPSVEGRKAPKIRRTTSQQNVKVQGPMSAPRANSPIPPPSASPSKSGLRRMTGSVKDAGPSTPVRNHSAKAKSGGEWLSPDSGDLDPLCLIPSSSHSPLKFPSANQPQGSLSDIILKLAMDHQIQLRANNAQWVARMDERERRLEDKFVEQRSEYQDRESELRKEYRERERRMEDVFSALREESKEREKRIEEYHHEKERRLELEVEVLRAREKLLEGQLRVMQNPASGHPAAPTFGDDRPPIRIHTGVDAAREDVIHPSASSHNGVQHAMDPSALRSNQKSLYDIGPWAFDTPPGEANSHFC